ncbi:hypothetical protein, partial [Roseomonas marmotae]|uniref:hypothetical protein n=1 Tax=Roseomonas marmotae TaxID=2768161 RepID=UPI001A97557D
QALPLLADEGAGDVALEQQLPDSSSMMRKCRLILVNPLILTEKNSSNAWRVGEQHGQEARAHHASSRYFPEMAATTGAPTTDRAMSPPSVEKMTCGTCCGVSVKRIRWDAR